MINKLAVGIALVSSGCVTTEDEDEPALGQSSAELGHDGRRLFTAVRRLRRNTGSLRSDASGAPLCRAHSSCLSAQPLQ